MTEFRNLSIRKKLISIQVTTAFLAVLICCIFFVLNDIEIYKDSSVRNQRSIAEIVGINAASTLEFLDRDAATQILLKLKSNPTILNAIIFDADGKEFARYNKAGEENFSFSLNKLNEEETQQHFEQNFLISYNQNFLVSYNIIENTFLGTVILRAELTGFRDIILGYIKIAALILLVSLVVALFISTILQHTITTRLLSLVNKTKEVAETGNYSVRVVSDTHDEIGILSDAYNNMLSQIEKIQKRLNEANISLEKRVEQRTAQLQIANKELEAFSYSVSHDLRAPLRAINSYAQLLSEDYGAQLDSEANRYTVVIIQNAKKMGQLIDDLLAFSRLGRTNLVKSDTDMERLATEVSNEIRNEFKERNIIFRINKLHNIQADPTTIKQVWINLISNAVKYSKLKEEAVIEIGSTDTGKEVIYFIKDNGAGFDMRYADKLFGVFQRLHSEQEFEGTGVGLAIVHRIISKHSGRVWAEGDIDNGATFYFSLPK